MPNIIDKILRVLGQNPLIILGAIVGGLAQGWIGAIVGGVVGLVLEEVFRR